MLPKRRPLKVISILVFLALCCFTILRSFSTFTLPPDPTNYINAAQNFINHGQFFVFSNWPSGSFEPVAEPFTEQPPGLPIFTIPFLLVFKEPVTAALVGEACILLLLYASIFALTEVLKVSPIFQIACAVAFTVFRPMVYIYNSYWSETLFIALTFWSIHFLVAAEHRDKPNYYWALSLLLAASATIVRTIGVFSVGIFLIAALRRKKSRFLWICLSFLSCVGPLAIWSIRNKLLYGATAVTHDFQNYVEWRRLLQPYSFVSNLISPAPIVRILTIGLILACLLAPFWGSNFPGKTPGKFKADFSKKSLIDYLVTAIGILIGFISIAADRIPQLGGYAGLGVGQILIVGLGALIAMAPWMQKTNYFEYFQYLRDFYAWYWQQSRRFSTFTLLLVGGIFQLLGIITVSLITVFSPLEERLLAPSLSLLLLAVLAGLYHLAHLKWPGSRPILVYGTALILCVFSPFFVKSELAFAPGLRIPPEQKLWRELYTYPGINSVSTFYTDNDFTHEIFAMRPQRIIADPDLLKKDGFLKSLIEKGKCPIVVTRVGTNQDLLMEQYYRQVGLNQRRISDNRYNLYYHACLLDPSLTK